MPDGIAVCIHDFGVVHYAGHAIGVRNIFGGVKVIHRAVQSGIAVGLPAGKGCAVGGAAASAAFAGETGRMISLKRISDYPYQCITESVDVQQVANLEKKVPLDWITPDGMQVTAAFDEYARPLILDEVTPVYVNGTPRHICL